MLNCLKKDIAKERNHGFVMEAAVKHAAADDEAIKDAFLDGVEYDADGAENDPEIAKLVEDLPEYGEDEEEMTDDELEAMSESYIPETKIG